MLGSGLRWSWRVAGGSGACGGRPRKVRSDGPCSALQDGFVRLMADVGVSTPYPLLFPSQDRLLALPGCPVAVDLGLAAGEFLLRPGDGLLRRLASAF